MQASSEAVESAVRALRHRDRTSAQLHRHLAERGFDEAERDEAVAMLVRTGVLDDVRYAENRAAALADRGAGDAYIRHDLAGAGLGGDEIGGALAGLQPEVERAERIVERRGASPKTARYLAGKGFSEDVVRGVVARAAGQALG
jgi:regulatory protein